MRNLLQMIKKTKCCLLAFFLFILFPCVCFAEISNQEHPQAKVSVIIPVYNTASYLKRCLDSAINQTLKDIEIICVNDGSTDNSLEILQEYQKKDNRIILINLKENKGVVNARNVAIEKASGEFIGFLDSDDFIDPGWYENLYNQSDGFDFIRGVYLRNGWFNPNYCYLNLIPSIIRKKFVQDHGLVFEDVLHEDTYYADNLRELGARTKDAMDNGSRYHYTMRLGSFMDFQRQEIQKIERAYSNHINVVFTVSDNNPQDTTSVIDAIIKHNTSKSKYIFWILERNLSDENKALMKEHVKDNNQSIAFIHLDSKHMQRLEKIYGKKENAISIAPILIPDLLPKTIEKPIYLENDAVITEDLAISFEKDFKR